MKKKLFTLLTLLLCLCSTAWAQTTYYLFTPTDPATSPVHTGSLSGDFYCNQSPVADSRTIDGLNFTHCVATSSSLSANSSWSSQLAGSYTIDYDMKTTSATFTIYAFNKSSSNYAVTQATVEEGADPSKHLAVTDMSSFTGAKKGTFTVTATTNKRVRISSSSNSNLRFYQIVVTETGTALPKPGNAENYTLDFSGGKRFAVKAKKTASFIDGIEISTNSDNKYSNTAAKLSNKGSHDYYIKFTTTSATGTRLIVTNANAKAYSLNTAGDAFAATTKASGAEVALNPNTTYWIKGNNEEIQVNKIEFLAPATPHKVSFNAGDHGTYTGGDITEESAGAGITLPNLTTLAAGYTFNGWYTASTGGTKAGNAGDAYTPTSDLPLYAQYSAKTYSITLDDNNGGTNNGSATATYDSNTLTSITAPTKAGSSVTGYYKETTYENLIADASGTLQANTNYTDASGNWKNDGDVTLYAQWEEATYTVTVAKNNNDYGTVTSASVADVAYNTNISATENVLSVGTTDITATPAAATAEYTYAFSNWTGIPDGGKVTDNVTVTANFTRTPVSYELAWNANGGDDLTGDYTQGSTAFGATITKPTATREGYVFLGWAESADGAVVNVPSTMPAANKTYYAQWIEGTAATVTYNLSTNSTSTTLDNCTSATPNSGLIIASTIINIYGTANCDGTNSAKDDETQKLKIDAEYTAANYYEWTFTENNCTFAPTNVKIKFQAVTDLVQYTVALTDGITTKTTNFVQTTAKGGTLETLDWDITDGTIFAANKTIKLQLWAYKKNSGATAFRLGSPIEIKGAVKALVSVSVGAKGYATYCNSDYALDFTDKSIKAFIAENPSGNEVTFTQVNKIAKGEPVLLYSETNSDSQLIPAIAESEVAKKTATENYFRKGDGTTAYEWADADESRIYVLNTTTKSPGFYKANKNKVATTKAYLSMPAGVNARFGGLFFDGETTGINAIDNGQLTIDNDAPMYNLAGQRVNKSYKGVVVQNGKKMLNK